MLVINKIDVTRLEDLTPDNRALVQDIIDTDGVQCVQVSCYSEEGVMDVKNKACDALLAQRVDAKLKGNKINTIINRIHVAQPKQRDEVVREPFIPEVVKLRKKFDKNDPDRRKLEKDIELEEGGAGVYNINLKSVYDDFCSDVVALNYDTENYHLANDEWKSDIIPEIMDGVDPDIAEKLEALEREEEMLEAEGFYEDHDNMVSSRVQGNSVTFQFD
jgi:nucleolar GTP-binding protein